MHQTLYSMALASPQYPAMFQLRGPLQVPMLLDTSLSSPTASETCLYPSKICKNPRARKSNGSMHRFCEYHRRKANVNQKRWVHRQRNRRKAESEGETTEEGEQVANVPTEASKPDVQETESNAGSETETETETEAPDSPTSVSCVPVCPLPDLTPLEAAAEADANEIVGVPEPEPEEDDDFASAMLDFEVDLELEEAGKPPISFTDEELQALKAMLFDDVWPVSEKTTSKPDASNATSNEDESKQSQPKSRRSKRVCVVKASKPEDQSESQKDEDEEDEQRAASPLPTEMKETQDRDDGRVHWETLPVAM